MSDVTIRTRPGIDIPLAIIAIGLTLLLAFTARGSLAPVAAPTSSPAVSAAPTVHAAPAQIAPAKEKGKGRD